MGGEEGEAFPGGGKDDLTGVCLFQQQVVDRAGEFPGILVKVDREVGLGIQVDQQGALPGRGQGRPEIGHRGGLADPALLVGDRDDPGHGRVDPARR